MPRRSVAPTPCRGALDARDVTPDRIEAFVTALEQDIARRQVHPGRGRPRGWVSSCELYTAFVYAHCESPWQSALRDFLAGVPGWRPSCECQCWPRETK
jgi:hypothetical protein